MVDPGASPHSFVANAAVLGFFMGAQAAAARHVRIADITTVRVNSTITGLAADSWFVSRLKLDWVKRLTAVQSILLRALCGAVLSSTRNMDSHVGTYLFVDPRDHYW